jgi:filamentous hemagglutinin
VEINANTDASFAGGVPVRPRDGQVPAGTAQVDTPIAKHLIEAEIKTNKLGQPIVVSGGHNMDNFNQSLQANGGQVIGTPKQVASGIYEVEYRLPGMRQGQVETKTVYDPAKYSDQQMASMANEAVGRGIYQWNKSGMGKVPDVQFVDVGGIKFEVPISSYRDKVYVPTAYPSGR